MTKEEQQARATLNDHIVIHNVTDNILVMHKDGTAVYAVDVIRKPLVRCKDCMWNDGKGHCKLRYGSLGVFEDVSCDDFCSYGECKEGE